MHASGFTALCMSSKTSDQSSSYNNHHIPISMCILSDDDSCINFSGVQCCHCGYRGAHSPTCPFR
ncbi:hypothetical protein BDR04DRAFT_1106317 [Suillus decipiens]|nr:hypothetical protein BDR04DRAFT_1106317 [Suillus decipiens]